MKRIPGTIVAAIAVMTGMLGSLSPTFAEGIHRAADHGDLAIVQGFLAGTPELVDSRDEQGMTPLHYAALNGSKELIRMLVASHADISARNDEGATPLHLAVIYRNIGAA